VTAPPVVVGRYRLDALVRPDIDPGTWRGTDLTTNRRVRVCLVDGETGAAARSRRTSANPGLLPVIDVVRLRDGSGAPMPGVDPRGEVFIVLEPADGETLDDLVRRKGALDPVRAVRLVLAVANGLAALHAAGTVHGSVMPLAIEVRPLEEGGPRLGLAGLHDGAMAYASPSRLCDGGPSNHDDAWGLLASLYFAVSGGPPFAAESPQALARRVLGGRPVPIRADTPALVEVQKMFDRGFSRTAAQRYPDVAALRDDLRAWLAQHGASSDEPLASMRPPPDVPPQMLTAITAKKPDVYPQAFPDATSSGRGRTAPWGDLERELAPASRGAPRTLAETPVAKQPETLPRLAVANARTEPPPRPRTEPPRASSIPPAGNDETARFTREQMLLLEEESDRSAVPRAASTFGLERKPTSEGPAPAAPRTVPPPAAVSLRPAAVSSRPAPAPAAVSSRPAGRPEVIERTIPAPKPSTPAPPPRRRNLPVALGVGGALALAGVAVLVVSFINKPAPLAPAPASSTGGAPASVIAPASVVVPASAGAPPPVASPAHVPSASASAVEPRSGGADELLTCVARSFPPDTFDPDADLAFLCSDRDGRKAAQRLRRAIVAGGRGARITEAMREWSRYRWYELPVLTTVRARCCPGAPPVEIPSVSAACSARRSSVQAVASAAAGEAGDIDPSLREYRRFVSCVMESGDFPAFGQDGPIGAGEEAAFRALVARGKK
jgi:serine/threonine protein kinase